ncbi:hypothetical protein A5775_22045 [Mycobacterium sp. 852002-10029_SCH5224772]|nr:hypothetical protein A5775_22045 [Mycobacterium sp. 852002-10029_SCH5224772]
MTLTGRPDRLAIGMLSVFGLPSIEFVDLVADSDVVTFQQLAFSPASARPHRSPWRRYLLHPYG